MNLLWRNCVLGLLCMSAQAVKVSQNPSTTFTLTVNSSLTITCSTTISDSEGLYLYRRFHEEMTVTYLSLHKGKITRQNKSPEFEGRVEAKVDTQSGKSLEITLTLSVLQLHDTNLYYCSWIKYNTVTNIAEKYASNGTIVIIKEVTKSDNCSNSIDIFSLAMSITAVLFVICLLGLVLFMTSNHFKRKFTPSKAANMSQRRPLPIPPQPIRPQLRNQTYSYLNTSQTTSDILDFPY